MKSMLLVLPDLRVDHATIEDMYEVSDLLYLYDLSAYGESDQTSEDLRSEWQTPPFNVTTDAWVARIREDQVDTSDKGDAAFEKRGRHVKRSG